jgi:acetolactate synthase small subunit
MSIYNNFYQNTQNGMLIYVYSVYDLRPKTKGKQEKMMVKFVDLNKTREIGVIALNSFICDGSAEFDSRWMGLKSLNEEDDAGIQDMLRNLEILVDNEDEVLKNKIKDFADIRDSIFKDFSINNLAEREDHPFVMKKKDENGSAQDIDEDSIEDITHTIILFVIENGLDIDTKNEEEVEKLIKCIEANLLQKIEDFGMYEIDINPKQIVKMIKELKKNG